jgi:hypothetical protein
MPDACGSSEVCFPSAPKCVEIVALIWKARSVSRSRRDVLPRRMSRRSGKAKPTYLLRFHFFSPGLITCCLEAQGNATRGFFPLNPFFPSARTRYRVKNIKWVD